MEQLVTLYYLVAERRSFAAFSTKEIWEYGSESAVGQAYAISDEKPQGSSLDKECWPDFFPEKEFLPT